MVYFSGGGGNLGLLSCVNQLEGIPIPSISSSQNTPVKKIAWVVYKHKINCICNIPS